MDLRHQSPIPGNSIITLSRASMATTTAAATAANTNKSSMSSLSFTSITIFYQSHNLVQACFNAVKRMFSSSIL